MEPERAVAGVTPELLAAVRARIAAAVLPAAAHYFGPPDAGPDDPALERGQWAAVYFDYRPCCVSALAALAAGGDERAFRLVRERFAATRFYLDEWRVREGSPRPVRRAHLHLVLAYERLRDRLEAAEDATWRDLLVRSAEDILEHVRAFQERQPALDNRAFGTGINHIAVMAEGIWMTGEVLGRPEWQQLAGDFVDRLVAAMHPDGYFEEHTNDAREGGPSLNYTALTAGCAYLVQRWRGAVDRDRFVRAGLFFRQFVGPWLRPMPFIDERANPTHLNVYGLALHALTPEGRGFLRLALDPHVGGAMAIDVERLNLEALGRLALELDHLPCGEGAVPEPFREGAFRLTLPAAVARSHGWTMGLSALSALNREILPRSIWALDRQCLVSLTHETAGDLLAGVKSKHDALWSTVRLGEDAYPTQTGTLTLEGGRARARVRYDRFAAEVSWHYGALPRLVITSDTRRPLRAQLVLEAPPGSRLVLDGGRTATLGETSEEWDQVRSVASDSWTVTADRTGRLVWPVSPFNPYSAGNVSPPQRAARCSPWNGRSASSSASRHTVHATHDADE
ncbi:MAG: hypothetical protein ACRDJN_19570 [Chloroflexota bacterium]